MIIIIFGIAFIYLLLGYSCYAMIQINAIFGIVVTIVYGCIFVVVPLAYILSEKTNAPAGEESKGTLRDDDYNNSYLY